MLQANLCIIEELRSFLKLIVEDSSLLAKFSTVPDGFTRRRKLPFDRLVLLIAKLCKKTLSVELEQFFDESSISDSCTVSAFCQQRMKLNPLFFRVWNELLCKSFYATEGVEVKRWKGYRVIAVDGSNISLVNTPLLREYFGGQSNQECFFVQAKAMYRYDVLNKMLLRAELVPYRTGELTVAYSLVDNLEEDMLTIYDRNFGNFKMIALHMWQEKERKFVIRAKESREIFRTFIKSGECSAMFDLSPTPSAIEGLRQHGYIINKNTRLTVRLVRVDLPESVEVLITNLWEEEGYANELFKDLYFMRWSVETIISHQKNILQLESFSGLSPLSVAQDFHATVFIANLHSIVVEVAQKTINETKTKKKYAMKVNGNKSYGKLKANIITLFISNEPEIILRTLHRYFVRDTLPIRPGRTFPRIVKNKQSRSKHKTFMNYKPAF
jgi:hypothetical protein